MEINSIPYVVIAENDPDSRLIYQEVIAKTDFQVEYRFVGGGSELLDQLKNAPRTRPYLVLMDLDLLFEGHDALGKMMEDEKTQAHTGDHYHHRRRSWSRDFVAEFVSFRGPKRYYSSSTVMRQNFPPQNPQTADYRKGPAENWSLTPSPRFHSPPHLPILSFP